MTKPLKYTFSILLVCLTVLLILFSIAYKKYIYDFEHYNPSGVLTQDDYDVYSAVLQYAIPKNWVDTLYVNPLVGVDPVDDGMIGDAKKKLFNLYLWISDRMRSDRHKRTLEQLNHEWNRIEGLDFPGRYLDLRNNHGDLIFKYGILENRFLTLKHSVRIISSSKYWEEQRIKGKYYHRSPFPLHLSRVSFDESKIIAVVFIYGLDNEYYLEKFGDEWRVVYEHSTGVIINE